MTTLNLLSRREKGHGAAAGASGPLWPAAHLWRYVAHSQPWGAPCYWGDPDGGGQAGPLVRDSRGEESRSKPDADRLSLQPLAWPPLDLYNISLLSATETKWRTHRCALLNAQTGVYVQSKPLLVLEFTERGWSVLLFVSSCLDTAGVNAITSLTYSIFLHTPQHDV